MAEEVELSEEAPPGVEPKPPSGFWRLATKAADWSSWLGDWACRAGARRSRAMASRARRRVVVMLMAPWTRRFAGTCWTVCQAVKAVAMGRGAGVRARSLGGVLRGGDLRVGRF